MKVVEQCAAPVPGRQPNSEVTKKKLCVLCGRRQVTRLFSEVDFDINIFGNIYDEFLSFDICDMKP